MWIFETEYLVVSCVLVLIALGGVAIITGRGFWLYWMGGALLASGGIWLIGWMIETDVERVKKVIYSIEQAAKENNHPTVLSHVSESRPQIYQAVKRVLPLVHIQDARVTAIGDITIDDKAAPKQAQADITIYVEGGDSAKKIGSVKFYRRLIVTFIEEEERNWRVIDYEEKPLIQKK